MTDLDRLIRSIRITAGYDDPVLMSAKQVFALTSEVLRLRGDEERLRAVEADAERVRVKAELWSYYEAFVAANGAGSITELVIQRDEARTAAVTVLRRVADAMEGKGWFLTDVQDELSIYAHPEINGGRGTVFKRSGDEVNGWTVGVISLHPDRAALCAARDGAGL